MTDILQAIPSASDKLPRRPTQRLSHLPGPRGHWLFGNLRLLGNNPAPALMALRARYGDCFTFGFLRNQRTLILAGPEANELVLLDRAQNLSSHWGWEVVLAFFGGNILVRDFLDHRQHRRLMTGLFKPQALARYLTDMAEPIEECVEGCRGSVDVYQTTKELALAIAVRVFAGIPAREAFRWSSDLNCVLSNVMALRLRVPGTRYWRALTARDRLRARLSEQIAQRRGQPGEDLFSLLVNNEDEAGRRLSDQDVVDHMFGLLFAAHDTTASALAMLCWQLAQQPELQHQLRAECETVCVRYGSDRLPFSALDELPLLDACFKETLRLYAPIQFLPRRSVSAFEFQGQYVPGNTAILLAPQLTHLDPSLFPDPQVFNAQRFQCETPPPFAYVPFGKGSHMCLGMHFAHMEIKAVLYHLLLNRSLVPADTKLLDLEYLPVVRPRTPMTVRFEALT